VASDANKTIAFLNGSNAYTWTIPPDVFIPGNWGVLRKTGDGEITIARGAGVTFFTPGSFGNNDIRIDGKDGYSIYWEMIREVLSHPVRPVVDAFGDYEFSPEFPTRYAVGQKILVAGFTNPANNGIKTVTGFPSVARVSVAETLVTEGSGDPRSITPLNSFLLSGAIKAV